MTTTCRCRFLLLSIATYMQELPYGWMVGWLVSKSWRSKLLHSLQRIAWFTSGVDVSNISFVWLCFSIYICVPPGHSYVSLSSLGILLPSVIVLSFFFCFSIFMDFKNKEELCSITAMWRIFIICLWCIAIFLTVLVIKWFHFLFCL